MNKILVISLGLMFFPALTHAQVLLSEIAWMGTDADANNEWIEIYNFSNTPTDLTGWTLTSDDGSISVKLKGILAPHAVGVLERTDDTTLPDITALLTYTGRLVNEGVTPTLTLKDAGGTTSDQAIGGPNWESIGGSNVKPKKTAQRTRTGSWVTAAPTPGAENAETNDPVIVTDTNTTVETNTSTKKSSSGGGGGSSKSSPAKKEVEIVNPVLALAFEVPHTVYVNEEVHLEAKPSGIGETIMDSLQYTWNFGDTYTQNGREVSHTYTRPGEYTMVLQGLYAKHNEIVRHDVTVLPTVFEITRAVNGDIIIHNKSPQEINLGGFALGLEKEFMFPSYTFVKAGGVLVVPTERVKKVHGLVALLDTKSVVVAYEKGATPKSVLNTGMTLRKPTPQPLAGDISPASEEVQKKTDTKPIAQVTKPEELTDDTVIQIGEAHASPEEGFVTRMFQKFTSLFGF